MALVAATAACGAGVDGESANDAENITGSLGAARACAVKEAYLAAPLTAFVNVDASAFPGPVTGYADAGDGATTYAAFQVPGLDWVYLSTSGDETQFFSSNGTSLASAYGEGSLSWSSPSGPVCAGASSSGDAGYPWGRDASAPWSDAGHPSSDGGGPIRDAGQD